MFVKYIQQETGTRVQIKGLGSGFVDQESGHEHDEPMYIHVTYVPSSAHNLRYADPWRAAVPTSNRFNVQRH